MSEVQVSLMPSQKVQLLEHRATCITALLPTPKSMLSVVQTWNDNYCTSSYFTFYVIEGDVLW